MANVGTIKSIWRQSGSPDLSGPRFRPWSEICLAVLAFGYRPCGIVGDPKWGRRINSTGTTSQDTFRYGDDYAVDICADAGSPGSPGEDGEDFHWLTFGPDDPDFGVGREPADESKLPTGDVVDPPFPPPPPPGDSGIRNLILAPGQGNYRTWLDQSGWLLDAEVQRHFTASSAGALRRFGTGDRNHFDWRMTHEILRWANPRPDGDLAQHGLTPPLTVGKLLDITWPGGAEPEPLPPAPSFLEMVNPIGNFLHPARMYFPPAAWVKSEATLRAWLDWHRANGYTVVLAMLEQTHWGTAPGRNPEWTRPDPATPLVFKGRNHKVFGWTDATAELHQRIEIARLEYGLEVVLSLWEQERIQFDLESAIRETPRIVAEFDDEVVAFRNSWEIDEVLSPRHQHDLNNTIGAAAGKPCGPHFARFMPNDDYWRSSDRANLLWHQYETSHSIAELVKETQQVVARNSRVAVVCDEHSPAVRIGSYTHAESRARGEACRTAGAFGGMNG